MVSGCSVALQSKPKNGGHDCSTSHAYWIADAVGAIAGAAALTYAIANRGGDGDRAVGGVGGVIGVLYLASAHNGFKWRRQCDVGAAEPLARR